MLQAAARYNKRGGNFNHQRRVEGAHPSEDKKASYFHQGRGADKVVGTTNRIPNLSVLHYGPKCELFKYERDMEEYARLHYGDLAQMFALDAYYVPDPIEIGEFNEEDNDMNEIDVLMYTEERKLRLREIYEMRKNRPKLFGAMWMQLS